VLVDRRGAIAILRNALSYVQLVRMVPTRVAVAVRAGRGEELVGAYAVAVCACFVDRRPFTVRMTRDETVAGLCIPSCAERLLDGDRTPIVLRRERRGLLDPLAVRVQPPEERARGVIALATSFFVLFGVCRVALLRPGSVSI
jgi:hypothetical protein